MNFDQVKRGWYERRVSSTKNTRFHKARREKTSKLIHAFNKYVISINYLKPFTVHMGLRWEDVNEVVRRGGLENNRFEYIYAHKLS